MRETKDRIRAKDAKAQSKGKLPPSVAMAQAAMRNKSMDRKQEHANQSAAEKESLECVRLHWCY